MDGGQDSSGPPLPARRSRLTWRSAGCITPPFQGSPGTGVTGALPAFPGSVTHSLARGPRQCRPTLPSTMEHRGKKTTGKEARDSVSLVHRGGPSYWAQAWDTAGA